MISIDAAITKAIRSRVVSVSALVVWVAALWTAEAGLATATESEAPAVESETVATSEREMVVLLHGLGRSSYSMKALAAKLEAAGFETANLDYPSTRLEAGQLGGMLGKRLDACCREAPRLHFVTHSLGGIVVRAHLAEHRPANLGRVVMLAPPNHGTELADFFSDVAVFRWILGPTAVELGTDPASFPNRLPEADFPLGIIAGTGVVNPVGAEMIPGEDDGTVSVESARLEGMTDFLEVDASHSFIMYSDEVAQQVITFLEEGRFERAPAEVQP